MTDETVLRIERFFDAPREAVFAAWTDPEQIVAWWGPEGMSTTESSFDVRPGGEWSTTMRDAHGRDYLVRGVYGEISPPHRLVFTWAWVEDGKRGHETVVTIELEDHGERTLMRFEQRAFESRSARDGHLEGWTSSLRCLDAHLA